MVTVEDQVDACDLANYAENKLAELNAGLPGYEDLNRNYFQTRSGLPACKAVYKWFLGGEIEIYQWVLLALARKTGYTLTATFSKETSMVWGEQVDEMFSGFDLPEQILPENTTGHTIKVLTNRFTINIPALWRDASIHVFEGPVEDDFRHDIVIGIGNDIGMSSIEAFAQINFKVLEQQLQGYHELKRGPYQLNTPLPAYELVYRWCPLVDHKFYCKVVYILFNGTGYTLSVKFTKKTWKIHGRRIDEILRTFTVPVSTTGKLHRQEPI